MTKEYNFAWVFMFAACLWLILGLEVTWWVAILVVLLANFDFKIQTTTHYRRR